MGNRDDRSRAIVQRIAAVIGVLMFISILIGCASEKQRQAVQMLREAQDLVHACQSKLESNPQYARVYQKLALDTVKESPRLPTSAQISDVEIISDSDKLNLLDWYSEAETCVTPAFESVGRIAPELQTYIVDAQSDSIETLYRGMTNSYTFGQANAEIANFKGRIKLEAAAAVNALKTRWGQEDAEMVETGENVALAIGYVALAIATRGQLAFERLARRQTLLARAQSDFLRTHPMAATVHRVRVIHCDGIGQSLRCVLTDASVK
jgi:hypothetical protein